MGSAGNSIWKLSWPANLDLPAQNSVALWQNPSGSKKIVLGDVLYPRIWDMAHRKKLSTTIGPDSFAYLHRLVKAGKAASVGEAVDKTVEIAKRFDNRATLARQTAAYFDRLPPTAASEEAALAHALSDASMEMDFEQP